MVYNKESFGLLVQVDKAKLLLAPYIVSLYHEMMAYQLNKFCFHTFQNNESMAQSGIFSIFSI